ncbi:hypothetical protein [Mesorhizobium sp. AR02]|uniref:hypothetical protein n=1 Tax=Mesorhizobium sp. AR02 TaxID=2865837 RepID=UPI00215E9A85|nr:hypothetical protein [Mesorhizobium sp. AR02]
MSTTELTQASETSSRRDFQSTLRSTLGGRRGLIAAGAAVVVAGLAFKWSWLVAAGIAPVLLSVLPCVAMCALGLCMNRMMGGSQSATRVTDEEIGPLQLAAPSDEPGAANPAASTSVGPIPLADKGCCQRAR